MDRQKTIIVTSIKGIVVNILLVIFKAIIGFITNSIAIILDAVNNLTDAMSSIITIIGTKLASKKPDKKHPYGHGRIEYFSAMIIAIIILLAGMTSFKESMEKIFMHEKANYTIVSLFIIAVAVIVKFAFGKYVKKIGEKINSGNLIASGSDAIFDSVLSFSTLIAGIISILWGLSIEGFLGVIISIIIIKASIEMLKETSNSIIGVRIDSKLARNIKETINSFNDVKGTYDLMLHNYGPTETIGSVHIEVPDDMSAKQIHKLTRDIRYKIYADFGIILTVGIYASNTDSEKAKEIKETVANIISRNKSIIQMHGFYVDEELKIITFDIIFEFDVKNKEEIRNGVIKELKKKYPEYKYLIIIDSDISD